MHKRLYCLGFWLLNGYGKLSIFPSKLHRETNLIRIYWFKKEVFLEPNPNNRQMNWVQLMDLLTWILLI